MYCSECRCEFEGWTGKCPNCRTPLVEGSPPIAETADEPISYEALVDLVRENGGSLGIDLSTSEVGREKGRSFPYFGYGLDAPIHSDGLLSLAPHYCSRRRGVPVSRTSASHQVECGGRYCCNGDAPPTQPARTGASGHTSVRRVSCSITSVSSPLDSVFQVLGTVRHVVPGAFSPPSVEWGYQSLTHDATAPLRETTYCPALPRLRK